LYGGEVEWRRADRRFPFYKNKTWLPKLPSWAARF
jgi:hypothetical protein